jgi:carboxypeptidase Taq
MGMHESQSRLLENQIGRSAAFCDWLFATMTELYGDIGVGSAADLHRTVNTVETGFIRTEADEVHYNLHVMLRFDLERALVGGSLQIADLEEAWNVRFREDFGLSVPDARRGVLQDVHWAEGLFGYFPSYTLGNVYASELHAALRRALPDLDTELSRGDPSAAIRWLNAAVHTHARLVPAAEIVEAACGRPPDPATLIGYLDAKYGELYGL